MNDEAREAFAGIIRRLGLGMARSEKATTWEEALAARARGAPERGPPAGYDSIQTNGSPSGFRIRSGAGAI